MGNYDQEVRRVLPVYICEDEEQIREAERVYIEKKILIEGYDMEIVACTGSPEELLEALSGEQNRGIYFLDVELRGAFMDGFELGQRIRKKDARGFLIYVTAYQELAFETFRYHLEALDYICKQDETQMYAGISHCLKVVTERMSEEKGRQQAYVTIKVLDVVRHIPVDEILYFSTTGRTHRIELHTERERLDFIGSMQELEQELGSRFLRIHRGCLVNADQIAGIDGKQKEILLQNGERCTFSRSMKRKILERMFVPAVR